jgi:hypothetical protein
MIPAIWPMATVSGTGALLQIANFGLTSAWWARW